MWKGSVETGHARLAELPEVFAALGSNQAMGLGIAAAAPCDIATEAEEGKRPGAISRTQKHFTMPEGPALAVIDCDTGATAAELTAALCEACPAFAQTETLIVPSTSAGIYKAGEAAPAMNSTGMHLYFPIAAGADLQRFGKALCRRLWLGGHGFIEVSAAGSLMVKQIIDGTVFMPERLIFEAAPVLGPGLERHPPAPVHTPGRILDTRTACPDLTPEEEHRYLALVDAAKLAREPKARKVKETYKMARGQEIATAQSMPIEKAVALVAQTLEGENLPPEWPLNFQSLGRVSVLDALADPARFDGQRLHDPIEPDYRSKFCAIYYANANLNPAIYSHAHGGKYYALPCPRNPALGLIANATAPTPPESWPEPEPLGDLAAAPPEWPWEVYPKSLRALGMEIERTMNVPAELPGLALLCAASIACRKVATVAIKDDHRQFPNLYGMAALPATTGKSPATRPIMAPLLSYQMDLRKTFKRDLRSWAGRWKVARAEIAALEKQAGKGEGDSMALAAKIASLEAVQDERPPEPILFCDNATSEAMARTLSHNGGKLGVFSADGRDVLALAKGRYSKDSEDVTVWLKAHAGDYLSYRRSAPDKPSFECHEPILSAFVAIQIDALKGLGTKALRDSGFLPRWLYIVPAPPDNSDYPEGSVSQFAQKEYAATMARLLEMMPDTKGDDGPAPHLCRMDAEARAAWKTLHDQIKTEALHSPPLLSTWLGKLPEHLARIALVFHLVECAERKESPGTITAALVARAAKLGTVLDVHARRAIALMGESGQRAQIRELWLTLDRHRARLADLRTAEGLGPVEAVKPRDLARYGWAGIENTEEARTALQALEVRGWLRLRTAPGKGTARDHELFELHPAPGGKR